MKDKCPTCGTECEIVGNGTTYHYEPPDWLVPYDDLESQLKESEERLAKAEQLNRVYESALKYYADPKIWPSEFACSDDLACEAISDWGSTAMEALAAKTQKE